MKRLLLFLMIITVLISGCSSAGNVKGNEYSKYSYEFLGTFNTVIQFMGYAKSESEFDKMAREGQARFEELNRLFDKYNDYAGVNNIKTINDQAGIKPVRVSKEIIDMLVLSKEWYEKTEGLFNVALGPVLSIWHDYREEGINDPDHAKLPPMELLIAADKKTDISKVIIDTRNNTVFLEETGMSLDVGGIAKGYATELVAQELASKGHDSFVINGGGNIRIVGIPKNGYRTWRVGIQDPDQNAKLPDSQTLDMAFISDTSLVSSGDYERYYVVDDQRYHHIIDPRTLMPATYFRAVTVMTEDSRIADILSTTLYLMPYEDSRALAQSIPGVDAYWVLPDRSIRATDNMKKSLQKLGGATYE